IGTRSRRVAGWRIEDAYPLQGRVVTVPSGCSQVMVPVEVMADGVGVPPLPICMVIVCVQSYCARPCTPPASNRRPPVMRFVAVTVDDPVGGLKAYSLDIIR